mgnify:CR=1 FL=1
MTNERLTYEVDQWHRAQAPRGKPDYWPKEATVCAIPQHHALTATEIEKSGLGIKLVVHHCTKCAWALVEPLAVEAGHGGTT